MMMLAACLPAQSELLNFIKSSINRVTLHFLSHIHAASPRSTLGIHKTDAYNTA